MSAGIDRFPHRVNAGICLDEVKSEENKIKTNANTELGIGGYR
jgi:hypothetical protein